MNLRRTRIQPLWQSRLRLLTMILAFFLSLICFRLIRLQTTEQPQLTKQAEQNWLRSQTIPAQRGQIYDRNLIALAKNVPATDLYIDTRDIKDINEAVHDIGRLLKLNHQQRLTIFNRLTQARGIQLFWPKLTPIQQASLIAHQNLTDQFHLQSVISREYPLGAITSHVIGYVSPQNSDQPTLGMDENSWPLQWTGRSGIEAQYDQLLSGQSGYHLIALDAHSRLVKKLKTIPAVAPNDIILTIDSQLQQTAMHALAEHQGSVVVIDVHDGGILAMASTPSYDNNLFLAGIDQTNYQSLLHDKQKPLLNRSIQGLYSPGSTVKPIMAIAGLRHHVVDEQTTIDDHGYYQLPNHQHIYRDWRRKGHGLVNIVRALAVSCDTFFYRLSDKLGIEAISQQLRQFGLGKKTGVDLAGEKAGLVPSANWKQQQLHRAWYPGETLITGIGQGFLLVTPIQMAAMAAQMARLGNPITPHLLLAIRDEHQQLKPFINQSTPDTEKVNVAPSIWQIVYHGMHDAIYSPEGTAHFISSHLTYTLLGKTGTTQVVAIPLDESNQNKIVRARQFNDHSSFIGFAPASDPKVAIAVLIEHEHGAPLIARQVLDDYFLHNHSEP